MNRKFILLAACLFASTAFAQQDKEDDKLANIDWQEDSTEITTINDIIRDQQEVTMRNSVHKHFKDVWRYKNYVNISYSKLELEPDEEGGIPTGVGTGIVPTFTSKWGATIAIGHSFGLHKPIANTVRLNIDWTWFDLNVNQFDHEGNGKNLYDSHQRWTFRGKDYYYRPWNLKKLEASYGMAIGPSITLAPFTYVNSNALHHIKLNFYWHIGFHGSLLYVQSDEDADKNNPAEIEKISDQTEKTKALQDHEKMKDMPNLNGGWGMTNSFGGSISWKWIGIGYEKFTAKRRYYPLDSDSYFSERMYDFKASRDRIYLQFRF